MTSKPFDFSKAFVSVDSQENGAEFEVISDDGKPTGFFICLAGPDSKRRKKTKDRLSDFFTQKHVALVAKDMMPKNRKQRRAEAAQAQAEEAPAGPSLRDLQMDDMVAATLSWRYPAGFAGPECTPDNVRAMYEKHPTLFEQVLEKAEDLDLFSKS